jgi:hypothetical protein
MGWAWKKILTDRKQNTGRLLEYWSVDPRERVENYQRKLCRQLLEIEWKREAYL